MKSDAVVHVIDDDEAMAAAADPNKSVQAELVKQLKARGVTATAGPNAAAPSGATELGAVRSAPLIDAVRPSGSTTSSPRTRSRIIP